jgi:hypothetical protein
MNNVFIPKINRNAFAEAILQMQANEGNDIAVVKAIQSKIDSYKGVHLYDVFIRICNDYQIGFHCQEIGNTFTITIRLNGQGHASLAYQDRHKDIALDLAHELYAVLAVEMTNEVFIREVKK